MSTQVQNEQIKQCVLIVQPSTSTLPYNPIFLDFNSITILEFNLSWLVQQQVKECFVVCTKEKEKIEKILESMEIKQMKVNLRCYNPEDIKTIGDVMRELYFHQDLAGDFLLVNGNIISNLNVKDLWRQHLARKQLSAKQNILTVALETSKANEIFILNDGNKQILQIHDFNKKFKVNTERIKITGPIQEITTHGNLSQAGIYACSLDVIKGFKQTFQHQNMNDFIVGILTSEIYSQRIYSYILKDNEKCIKINQPYDYFKAYHLLLNRYLYPYCVQKTPPSLLKNKLSTPNIQYFDYNKYLKSRIPLRGSNIKLSHNIYIGEQSKIQQNTTIFKTIVCKNTVIGTGSNLKYCIVMENTVVPKYYNSQNSLLRGQGDSFEAISWQDLINQKSIHLDTEELFVQQAEEGQNFEQELKIILSETPSSQTIKQLSSLRKGYNKTCRQFIAAMIVNLNPDSKQNIQKITDQWGQLLRKASPNADELLCGIADACLTKQTYQPKFPFFLMNLYQDEHLNEAQVITWYDSHKQNKNWQIMITKSTGIVDKLREDDEQDEDDE